MAALYYDNAGHSYDDEEIGAAVAAADATETLYDFARLTLSSVLATVDAKFDLPYKSPDPEIDVLKKRDDAEESSEDESAPTDSAT